LILRPNFAGNHHELRADIRIELKFGESLILGVAEQGLDSGIGVSLTVYSQKWLKTKKPYTQWYEETGWQRKINRSTTDV